MATRRRKKKTTKRYRVRRPTTKRGMTRRTARRAYYPKRRARTGARRRRNPTGFTQTPAFRYGASALAGAAAGAFVNQMAAQDLESPLNKFRIPIGEDKTLSPAVTMSLVLLALSNWVVKKAKTRSMLVSAGLGMLAPAAIAQVTEMATPKNGNGNGAPTLDSTSSALTRRSVGRLRAPRARAPQAAQYFTSDLIPA